ncbi:DUF2997 domain-containing protein [Staphylospora marina]|uniref:DUF2997 domain-containing protein n=1 Tax=Staphylospora marina TaxID=2490858 RepID=UPI000F5BBE0C|nr:DUF2997 domain-containing protein [Staphylospora marina]
MKKRVKIRLFPDGTIQAEVEGVKGKRCTDYIGILEELLEAETVDSDFTPEYYEEEEVHEQTEQQQRLRED